MTDAHKPDPVDALRRFVERVTPYDPDPYADPVTVIEVRHRHATERLALTAYLTRALDEALARYQDPGDRGRCGECGGPLDDNLHCAACGRLHGVFGALVAEHAARSVTGRGAAEGPTG